MSFKECGTSADYEGMQLLVASTGTGVCSGDSAQRVVLGGKGQGGQGEGQ